MSAIHHPDKHAARQRHRGGFTLLEIIVVVTIIALLATLVAPKVLRHIGKTKQKVALAGVESIGQQVNLWMIDAGMSRLPDDFDLEALAEGDDPLLEPEDLIDPWGRTYILINPGIENRDFDVMTYGLDGEPGGEGEDGDVVN